VFDATSKRRAGSRFGRSSARQALLIASLILLVLLTLVPILFMFYSSLKSNGQILRSFWSLPAPPHWENYENAFTSLWRYIVNTVLYAAGTGTLVIALSSVSGYLFAKKTFPGKEFLFLLLLAMMMVPGVLTLIPAYVWFDSLGLTNTPLAIIIGHAAGGQIFGTFLCRTSMEGVPSSLFEAARMDGAKEWVVFWRIVLPLSVPILATIFIMQAVGTYNDYVWPLLTISDNSMQMIGVGLTQFTKQFGVTITDKGLQAAGYTLSSVPLIIVFAFGMKYYIQGMAQGAIKM